MFRLFLTFICICISCNPLSAQQVKWQSWSPQVFEKAKSENKLVLLNLKANWCHWCHVMEDSTYGNPKVADYINKNFIAVEADHDQRPDLAARYRDWGWPATIVFNSKGEEILKRAGFVAPNEFIKLLKKCVKNPVGINKDETADKAESDSTFFASTLLPLLKQKNIDFLDTENGGFSSGQKSIDWDTYEYALNHYTEDSSLQTWLKKTIVNARGIMDKEWGGVYQYSTYGDWNHPHFEKLLSVQARYIRIYTWYYKQFSDTQALQTAEKIAAYCYRFLWNEGKGFYNAQDADLVKGEKGTSYFALSDEERIKKGVPAIDKHIFTSNNAMMCRSLILLWAATGKEKYLDDARTILAYIITNRKNDTGGFRHHDEKDDVQALADQLPVAEALILMYRVTANTEYLEEAIRTADFIHSGFRTANGNYQSDKSGNGLKPNIVLSENIDLCRLFNLFSQVSGKHEYKMYAEEIFNYLSSSQVIKNISTEPGIISAYEELQREPITGTFLVFTPGTETFDLLREMIAYPKYYFCSHTYGKNTIPESKKEIFDSFDSNILFFCTSLYCSSPVTTVAEVRQFLYSK